MRRRSSGGRLPFQPAKAPFPPHPNGEDMSKPYNSIINQQRDCVLIRRPWWGQDMQREEEMAPRPAAYSYAPVPRWQVVRDYPMTYKEDLKGPGMVMGQNSTHHRNVQYVQRNAQDGSIIYQFPPAGLKRYYEQDDHGNGNNIVYAKRRRTYKDGHMYVRRRSPYGNNIYPQEVKSVSSSNDDLTTSSSSEAPRQIICTSTQRQMSRRQQIPQGYPRSSPMVRARQVTNVHPATVINNGRSRGKIEKEAAPLLLSLALASELLESDKKKDSESSSFREDSTSSTTETKTSSDENGARTDDLNKITNKVMLQPSVRRSPHVVVVPNLVQKKSQPFQPITDKMPPVPRVKTKRESNGISNMLTSQPKVVKLKPYKCEAEGCGCSFSTRFSLKRHMKKHTGERPHICPYNCGKRFAEKSTLTRHVRIHTGEKPYVCKFPGCNKSFADRTNVKRHELIHLGQRPYQCKYCNRGFFRPKQVVKHVAKMHPERATES